MTPTLSKHPAYYEELAAVTRKLREAAPLIHCITNPISINQCANAILAVGGRPMMAEHPAEVAEITKTAGALVLNLGNITDARMASMPIAAKTANEYGIPIVLDAVGLAGSALRREFTKELLENARMTLIKGNYSEIMTLVEEDYRATGVDAAGDLSEKDMVAACAEAARKYGCMILATGATDILVGRSTDIRTDPTPSSAASSAASPDSPVQTPATTPAAPVTVLIRNGSPMLPTVTGTGCMLGALCGAFLAASPTIYGALTACVVMGIAGERAEAETAGKGTGSFAVSLMDHISTLSAEELAAGLNVTLSVE